MNISIIFNNYYYFILDREVVCQKDSIDIMLRFDDVFDGEVYAKNFYDRPACRTGGTGQSRLRLFIAHNSCGVINDIDVS